MSEYTPTTEDIKTHFANEFDSYYGWQWDDVKAQQFDRWLAGHDAELEAELEARIEDRDYWYRIATEVKDQRDAALSAIAKVRELHSLEPVISTGFPLPSPGSSYCSQGCEHPCPTIRALGSVPSTGEGNDAALPRENDQG